MKYVAGILIFSILSLVAFSAPPRTSVDLRRIEDVIQVVAAITNRHPNFVSLNTGYRRNLFELYSQAGRVLQQLGANGSPPDFGATDFLSMKYSAAAIRYNEEALKDIRDGLIRDLETIGINELGTIEKTVGDIKALSKKDGNFDHKLNKKKVNALMRVMPLLYDDNLNAKFSDIHEAKKSLVNKILLLEPGDLDNMYNDTFKLHQQAALIEKSKEDKMGNLVDAVSGLTTHVNAKVNPALIPLPVDGAAAQALRQVSIERVPPLAGIVRGCFGGDCSIATVPFYPLVKGTWVYWIRKNDDINSPPSGYALVTTAKYQGRDVPYIITTNGGTLSEGDIRAVKHLVAKDFKTTEVLTHDFEKGSRNVVNSDTMRRGLQPHKKGQHVTVEMPPGWDQLRSDYYSPEHLKHAVLEDISKDGLHQEDFKITHVETPYPRPKKLSDMSQLERSLLAAQATEQRNFAADMGEVTKALAVSAKDVQLAQAFLKLDHNSPMTAGLYQNMKFHFGVGPEILTKTDYLTGAHSLRAITKADASLIPADEANKMAAGFAHTVTNEFEGLLREAPQLGRNQVRAGFSAVTDAMAVLHDFNSPKMVQEQTKFVDLLFSDREGDRALESIDTRTIIESMKKVLPNNPGHLTHRAIEALGNENRDSKALAKAFLTTASDLDSEFQVALLDKLTDPDAMEATREVLKARPSIHLSASAIVRDLVLDPDAGEDFVKNHLIKIESPISEADARAVYDFILKRPEDFDDDIPLQIAKILGPISPEQKAKLSKLLEKEPKIRFLALHPRIFSELSEGARQNLIHRILNSEKDLFSFQHFLRNRVDILTEKEMTEVLGSLMDKMVRNRTQKSHAWNEEARVKQERERKRTWNQLSRLFKDMAKGKNAEKAITKLALESNHPALLFKMGRRPIDFRQWEKLYKAKSAALKKQQWGLNSDLARYWRVAFLMGEPMPTHLEDKFWNWVKGDRENGEDNYWNQSHRFNSIVSDVDPDLQRYSTNRTTLSDDFYEKMFALAREPKTDQHLKSNVLRFFAAHPNSKYFRQFTQLLRDKNVIGSNDWTESLDYLLNNKQQPLTEKQKQFLFNEVAKAAKKHNSSRAVNFLDGHGVSCKGTVKCHLLDAYEASDSDTTKQAIENLFSIHGLAVEAELAQYKTYSPLELAEKWYEESFDEKSKWLAMAKQRGLDTILLKTLQENTAGHRKYIDSHHPASDDARKKVFLPLTLEDPTVIDHFVPRYEHGELPVRFLIANREKMNSEGFSRALNAIFSQLKKSFTDQPQGYNEETLRQSHLTLKMRRAELLAIGRLFAEDPRAKNTVIDWIIGKDHGNYHGGPFALGMVGKPFSFEEWETIYDKQVAAIKKQQYRTIGELANHWKIAFLLGEPMPPHIEAKFWDWVEGDAKNGDVNHWNQAARVGLIVQEANPELQDFYPTRTILSDDFYKRLFDLAKQKRIDQRFAKDVFKFFSAHPNDKYFRQFTRLLRNKEVIQGNDWAVQLDYLITNREHPLTEQQKDFLFNEVAKAVKQHDSTNAVQFLAKYGVRCDGTVKCHLLEAYEGSERDHTKKSIDELFSKQGLAVETELAAYKAYSPIELAERWLDEDFNKDSKWLVLAQKQRLSPESLIKLLQDNVAGHAKYIGSEASHSSEALKRIFLPLTLKDPKIIAKFIPNYHTSELDEAFVRNNRENMNEESFSNTLHNIFYQLSKALKDRPNGWNEENLRKSEREILDRRVRLLALAQTFGRDPRAKNTVLDWMIGKNGGNYSQARFAFGLTGTPLSFADWEELYDKNEKALAKNQYRSPSDLVKYWRAAFLLDEPMPAHVETKFWDWVEGEKDNPWNQSSRIISVIEDTEPDLQQYSAKAPTFSDDFYIKMFRLTKDKKANPDLPSHVAQFYSAHPNPKFFNEFLDLFSHPQFFRHSNSWPNSIEYYLKGGATTPESREALMLRLTEIAKAKNDATVLKVVLKKLEGAVPASIKPLLLDIYESHQGSGRKELKAFFTRNGIDEHRAVKKNGCQPKADELIGEGGAE